MPDPDSVRPLDPEGRVFSHPAETCPNEAANRARCRGDARKKGGSRLHVHTRDGYTPRTGRFWPRTQNDLQDPREAASLLRLFRIHKSLKRLDPTGSYHEAGLTNEIEGSADRWMELY